MSSRCGDYLFGIESDSVSAILSDSTVGKWVAIYGNNKSQHSRSKGEWTIEAMIGSDGLHHARILHKHQLPPFFRHDWDPAEDTKTASTIKNDVLYSVHTLQINWKKASDELEETW